MGKVILTICLCLFACVSSHAQAFSTVCNESNVSYPSIAHSLNTATLKRVEPKYPAAAKAVNVSGAVVVRASVDQQGNVKRVSVVCGHALLRAAAVNAVWQWKFKSNFGWDDQVVFRNRRVKTLFWDVMVKFVRD